LCSFVIITINRSIPILGSQGSTPNSHHDDGDANDRGRRGHDGSNGRGHDGSNGRGHDDPNGRGHDMVQRLMLLQ
jgi:hypothetical protein